VPNFKPHSRKLTAQLMIPEAQHFDSLFLEKLITLFIPGALVGIAVSATVEFDGQLCYGAVEIQKVDAAAVLAAEFEIVEAMVAQQTP